MRRRRDRNDPDVLIETYEGRIKNHKTKIKELKKLRKQLSSETDVNRIDGIDENRIEEIEQEIESRKEQIEDYRYDIRHLKKLLKKETSN